MNTFYIAIKVRSKSYQSQPIQIFLAKFSASISIVVAQCPASPTGIGLAFTVLNLVLNEFFDSDNFLFAQQITEDSLSSSTPEACASWCTPR